MFEVFQDVPDEEEEAQPQGPNDADRENIPPPSVLSSHHAPSSIPTQPKTGIVSSYAPRSKVSMMSGDRKISGKGAGKVRSLGMID